MAEGKKEKQKFPEVNTALHILKGAVVKVLHTPLTTTTDSFKPNEGRLCVEYKEATAPTKEQLDKIEELANQKIKENVEILYFPMNRAEAEEKYTKNLVNETFIYDKFPVPPQIKEVKIVEIPDWNVNCSVGPLLKRTGEIRQLKVKKTNHRANKQELEFVFELSGTVVSASGEPSKEAAKAPEPEKKPEPSNLHLDNVHIVGGAILDEFFASLKANGVEITPEKEKAIRRQMNASVETKLTILKNTAFGRGATCKPEQSSIRL